MKREALNHTKMLRLARKLDVPLYAARGIMESLWHLAAREAPAGDIGKLSNEDIAMAIDWRGDAAELVKALCEAGWIDEHHLHIYVVHDWHEHAEDNVHSKMARAGMLFADGNSPKTSKLSRDEREAAEALLASARRRNPAAAGRRRAPKAAAGRLPHLTLPDLTSPDQTTPNQETEIAVAGQEPPAASPLAPGGGGGVALDTEQAIAARYVACFNAALVRKLRVSPQVIERIRERLKRKYKAWQIVSLPIMVMAQGLSNEMRKAADPLMLLRDGKSPRTSGGQTYGATDWLERALNRLDQTHLDERIVEIARQFGVLDELIRCGAQIHGLETA